MIPCHVELGIQDGGICDIPAICGIGCKWPALKMLKYEAGTENG